MKIIVDLGGGKHYTYDSGGFTVAVGDIVALPPGGYRDSPMQGRVVALGSDYDGPLKTIWGPDSRRPASPDPHLRFRDAEGRAPTGRFVRAVTIEQAFKLRVAEWAALSAAPAGELATSAEARLRAQARYAASILAITAVKLHPADRTLAVEALEAHFRPKA